MNFKLRKEALARFSNFEFMPYELMRLPNKNFNYNDK